MSKDFNLNELFDQVRKQPVEATFEETKSAFLAGISSSLPKTKSNKVQFLSIKNGLIMLGLIGIVVTSMLLWSNASNVVEINKKVKSSSFIKTNENNLISNYETEELIVVQQNKIREFSALQELPLLKLKKFSPQELMPFEKKLAPKVQQTSKITQDFIFPKLTKDEIEENHKQKKRMIKSLIKLDKKIYAYVPSGSFNYEGQPVSVQGFAMQKTEVTNLEYRTFLFDLLIQGRKDEFKKAAPEQNKWIEICGIKMKYWKEDYFADHKFNDYPVVNVNREGAEMYCVWFSEEVQKFLNENGKKDNDYKMNNVRLPYKLEWIKAASVEGKLKNYAWIDSSSPTCFKGNFSTKDYNRISVVVKKTGKEIPFGDTSAVSTAGYLLNHGDLTTKVASYEPNEYELYDMSGNVAEMSYEHNAGDHSKVRPIALGGGWMNSEENVKINSKENYLGVIDGHPNIGFRVVMTVMGRNWQFKGLRNPLN
jgi:formylglycine-generating enzyme required for sulfatase activity